MNLKVLLPGAAAEYLADAGHYVLEDSPGPCLAAIRAHFEGT